MVATTPFGSRQPIVGREREQEFLRACLAEAIEGHGGLVLVSGEAGIGKTTLLRDLIQQAEQQGAVSLSGNCYDMMITPPYGPWSEVVRGYVPEADWPLAPVWLDVPGDATISGSQPTLFEEVQCFFSQIAERQPVSIVLEDLHWADPASLDLLRYLGRQLSDKRILLTVTYRDDEVTRKHILYQLTPILVRESQAHRLHLSRLDREAIMEFVAHRYVMTGNDSDRHVAHIWQRSEGNPFFAREILHGLEDERVLQPTQDGWLLGDLDQTSVPALLRQALDARLVRLAPEARSALQAAAVIGQDVPLDLWQTVADLDGAELDRVIATAFEMRLVEEDSDPLTLRFHHALLRDALYASLLVSQRRAVHRRVGEALATMPNPQPDVVANHFKQAADLRALEWLLRAGLRANQSAAWLMAAKRFESAAALLDQNLSQARLRAWLLLWAVLLSRYSHNPRSAGYLVEAERLAQVIDDPVLPAYLLHVNAVSRGFRGEVRRAVEGMEAAVLAFDEIAQTRPVAYVDEMAAAVIEEWLSTQATEPYPVSAPPMELVDKAPRASQQRGVFVIWLTHAGYYRRARQQGEAFIAQMTEAFGNRHLARGPCLSGHASLGHAYAALGFPDDARLEFRIAREGFVVTGDFGMVQYCAWLELLVVTIPYRTDRIAERDELVRIGEQARNRSIGMTMTVAHPTHSRLLVDILEGRWGDARQQAIDGLSAVGPDKRQSAIVNLGILARGQGEPDLAWRQVERLLPDEPDTEPGDSWFAHSHAAQRLAVELALDAHDLDLAHRWIEAHGRWLEWSEARLWQPHHQLLWAQYHYQSGDLVLARLHADQALCLATTPRQPLILIAIHRLLGELATIDKRFFEGETHLRESLAMARACAAPYEQALTLLALARSQLAAGQPETARPLQPLTVSTPSIVRSPTSQHPRWSTPTGSPPGKSRCSGCWPTA